MVTPHDLIAFAGLPVYERESRSHPGDAADLHERPARTRVLQHRLTTALASACAAALAAAPFVI